MYKLFNTIGKEKIAWIRSILPSYVLNLTIDETKYVMAEVLMQKVGQACSDSTIKKIVFFTHEFQSMYSISAYIELYFLNVYNLYFLQNIMENNRLYYPEGTVPFHLYNFDELRQACPDSTIRKIS